MSRYRLIQQIRQLSKQPIIQEVDYSQLSNEELNLIIETCQRLNVSELVFETLPENDKALLKDVFIKLQTNE